MPQVKIKVVQSLQPHNAAIESEFREVRIFEESNFQKMHI